MAFLDNLKAKVTETTQSASKAAKNVAETAKLNSQVNDLNKTINSLYGEIGKLYYEKTKDAPDADFEALFTQITESNTKIAEVKEQLRVIKGVNICPSCGGEVPANQKFCSNCGAQVITETATPAAEETVCPTCGEKVPAGTKFCSKCGSAI